MEQKIKVTTLRNVGNNGKQTTIPSYILKGRNVTGIKWTLTDEGKIIIEVVE